MQIVWAGVAVWLGDGDADGDALGTASRRHAGELKNSVAVQYKASPTSTEMLATPGPERVMFSASDESLDDPKLPSMSTATNDTPGVSARRRDEAWWRTGMSRSRNHVPLTATTVDRNGRYLKRRRPGRAGPKHEAASLDDFVETARRGGAL